MALGKDDGAQRGCSGVVIQCVVQTQQGGVCLNNGSRMCLWRCLQAGRSSRQPSRLSSGFAELVLSVSCPRFRAVGFYCYRFWAVGFVLSISCFRFTCCRFLAVGFVLSASSCQGHPRGFALAMPRCRSWLMLASMKDDGCRRRTSRQSSTFILPLTSIFL